MKMLFIDGSWYRLSGGKLYEAAFGPVLPQSHVLTDPWLTGAAILMVGGTFVLAFGVSMLLRSR